MLTYETLVAVIRELSKQKLHAYNRYLTAEVYDLGVQLGYDMSSYTRVEPTVFPTPTQPAAHYKHYMKFQKAKRKRK